MKSSEELVLGLKPAAQQYLLPEMKVVRGLEISIDAVGNVSQVTAASIDDEPVRRAFWEQVSTKDWEHIDLIIWGFPFRDYRKQGYRMTYRRIEHFSEALRTFYVSVVEIVDDFDRPIAESVWSDAEILAAIKEVEEQRRLGDYPKFIKLMRHAMCEVWSEARIEKAKKSAGISHVNGPEDWKKIFIASWRSVWEDPACANPLADLLERAGDPGKKIFERYAKYVVAEMFWTIDVGCRKDAASLSRGTDWLAWYFLCQYDFVKRVNMVNIADMYSYARDPRVFSIFC